jgi:hypothetical protein
MLGKLAGESGELRAATSRPKRTASALDRPETVGRCTARGRRHGFDNPQA